jgi:hypothetical protein
MEANPTYTFCYRPDRLGSGPVMKQTISVKNIRHLAMYLNTFRKNNPHYIILVAYLSNDEGVYTKVVKFLPAEYKAQRWLTGWKERLLANAVENGYDISWNHGLKPIKTQSMSYETVVME